MNIPVKINGITKHTLGQSKLVQSSIKAQMSAPLTKDLHGETGINFSTKTKKTTENKLEALCHDMIFDNLEYPVA